MDVRFCESSSALYNNREVFHVYLLMLRVFSVNIRIANNGSQAFFSIRQEYLKLNFLYRISHNMKSRKALSFFNRITYIELALIMNNVQLLSIHHSP